MAGTIIVSNLKTDTDNSFIVRSNTGATLFSCNTSGLDVANTIPAGSITSSKIASVSNTAITGLVTAAQIASLANTQITGTLIASQIASINASTATSGTLPAARLPVGSVLQVVSTTMTDTASTSSGTFNDISGLSVSITPTSASSKILVLLNVTGGNNDGGAAVQLVRNSTAIAIATSATGSRVNASFGNYYNNGDANSMRGHGLTHLDSPATTSSVTYKAQFRVGQASGGREFYINRANGNDDATYNIRTVSTITVMEIVG